MQQIGGHFVDDLNCQEEKIVLPLAGNGESLNALKQAKRNLPFADLLHVSVFVRVSLEAEPETRAVGRF